MCRRCCLRIGRFSPSVTGDDFPWHLVAVQVAISPTCVGVSDRWTQENAINEDDCRERLRLGFDLDFGFDLGLEFKHGRSQGSVDRDFLPNDVERDD